MPKENNGLLIAVLGVGALFLLAKSGDKETAVVKKKQEKAIADGTPPKVAASDDPIPKDKPERNRLMREVHDALSEYMDISKWIDDNAKDVQKTGLPRQIMGRLLALRTFMIELSMRGAQYYSQSTSSGEDFEFWRIWRGVFTGIYVIADRQRQRWVMHPPDQFTDTTHIDDSVSGEDDPQDGFDTLPELSEDELGGHV